MRRMQIIEKCLHQVLRNTRERGGRSGGVYLGIRGISVEHAYVQRRETPAESQPESDENQSISR